ncbi:CAP Gly-rich domain-containing protein [Mrakia frigida]|uniref:tubulin-folding cofactor B n=1 Tax=Mrakia frigida TaxID=29902 RepID=UPI003FCC1787
MMQSFRPTPQVTVWVTSPDTHSERKLDPDLTVAQLKSKFELITGISMDMQALSLLRADEGELVASMDDSNRTLGSYGVVDWMCIKVTNKDPNAVAGAYTDSSNVQKFELTETEYEARRDTVHTYLKTNKLGPKFGASPSASPASPKPTTPSAPLPSIGDRCEVDTASGSVRGSVKFVGETEFGKGASGGAWVGVELDEPGGKNDGSVEGKKYFTAKKNYGIFVRPEKVTVGDFPEEDFMDEDEEEI